MLSSTTKSHLCALGAVVCWAGSYVYTKVAMLHFSAAALGFWRCLIASLLLLVVMVVHKLPPPKLRDIPKFFLSAVTGFSVYLLFFNEGTRFVTSATSCIVIATAPIMTAFIASFVFGEKLSLAGWLAIAMAFGGIITLSLWGGVLSLNMGIVWLLIAAFLLASYNILQRKYSKFYSPLQITTYAFFVATATLVMFVPESIEQMRTASMYQAVVVFLLGVFPSAVAYLLWTKALGLARHTSDVANYMFLTPLMALVMGYYIMDELPDMGTFIGGGMILSGLMVFNMANRHKAKRELAAQGKVPV